MTYKIASQNEGAFAFRTKDALQQPEYPLAFVERNLQFQLEYEGMQERAKAKTKGRGKTYSLLGRGTCMLSIALRMFFIKKLSEYNKAAEEENSKIFPMGKDMEKFFKELE